MNKSAQHYETAQHYDVVVIGGGAAGLSAAVTLGRARRSVIVVDAGEPRNAPAAGVHGFLSRDGLSPLALLRIGRTEAESYGAVIVNGTAITVARAESADGFVVTLADGTVVRGGSAVARSRVRSCSRLCGVA